MHHLYKRHTYRRSVLSMHAYGVSRCQSESWAHYILNIYWSSQEWHTALTAVQEATRFISFDYVMICSASGTDWCHMVHKLNSIKACWVREGITKHHWCEKLYYVVSSDWSSRYRSDHRLKMWMRINTDKKNSLSFTQSDQNLSGSGTCPSKILSNDCFYTDTYRSDEGR